MTQEHLEKLIHRELDGEITARERTLLREQVAQDGAFRDLYHRLHQIDRALGAVPQRPVPGDLKPAVLSAIDEADAARPATRTRPTPAPRRRSRRRDAYAFSVGVAAGVALIAVIIAASGRMPAGSPDLVGGMLPRPDGADWTQVDRADLGSVGSATLRARDHQVALVVQLDTVQETSLVVEFDQRVAGLVGFTRSGAGMAPLQSGENRLATTLQGAGTLQFVLRRLDEGVDLPLRIDLRAGDSTLSRTLRMAPAGP